MSNRTPPPSRPQRIHLYLYPEDRSRLDGLHRQCQQQIHTPLSLSLFMRLLIASPTPDTVVSSLMPSQAGQRTPSGENDTPCRG